MQHVLKSWNNVSLLLFKNKLKQVYDFCKTKFPEGPTGSLESLDDDSIITVLQYKKKNVCRITKRNRMHIHLDDTYH